MRRTAIVASTVVAALAIGAIFAAAASAAPSWHYCAKTVPKNTGNYSDKMCSLAGEPGHGKYELLEGVGKGKGFKGKVLPDYRALTVTIPHRAELHVECAKASISGRPVAPRGVAGVRITFSKCELLGASCGTISTEALSGELGWLDEEAGLAGVSLTNEAEPGTGLVTQVSCTFSDGQVVKFRSNGAFVGELPANGPISKERTLNYQLAEYLKEETGPTNPPAFEEGFVGTLQTEINSPESKGEWTPEGGYRSGIEATFPLKGEALSIF
jgi:hypothetical protein